MNIASRLLIRKIYPSLFVVALVLRLLVFLGYLMHDQRYFQTDSRTYDLVAASIASHKGVVSPDGSLQTHRVPGYPLFLAILYTMNHSHFFALLVQIFLAAFIPVLVYRLGRKVFPDQRKVASLAGIIASVHIGFVLYSGFLMTETLFIFLFLIFMYYFMDSSIDEGSRMAVSPFGFVLPDSGEDGYISPLMTRNISLRALRARPDALLTNALIAGFFLGLVSMVRPVGHYMMPVIIVALLLKEQTWRQYFKSMIALIFAWGVVVAPWLIRNYLFTGALFFHTLPGGHFLQLSAARVIAHEQNISYQQARADVSKKAERELLQQRKQKGRKLMEIERCNVLERYAKEIFMSYPLTTIKLWLTDIFRTAFSLYSAELMYLEHNRETVDYFNTQRTVGSLFMRYLWPDVSWRLRIIIWAEILMFLILLIAAAVFVVRVCIAALRKKTAPLMPWRAVATFILFGLFFVVIGLAGGYARMRLPAEPFLILLAAAGIAWKKSSKRVS